MEDVTERRRIHDLEVHFTSELQEYYRRLQELEKLRDDLTHMIIHDLRTPLTSVIAGMQTLELVGDLNMDQPEMMDNAIIGGETLLGMINDLRAESKHLVILQQGAADLPQIIGDENKLRRNPERQSLVFSVSDTGEGTPSEAFGRIFEKFSQMASRKGGRTTSTGLGLTFCKLAVEAHGGQVDVESTLGQGSTFCFTIPLTTAK